MTMADIDIDTRALIDIDTKALIAFVQKKRELWDRTHEAFRDRIASKTAWEEVCGSLYEDFQTKDEGFKNIFTKEAIKRWSNVRDSYAKFCKKRKEAKSVGRPSKFRKYVYHDQLTFLAKLYDSDNVVENHEEERERNNIHEEKRERKNYHEEERERNNIYEEQRERRNNHTHEEERDDDTSQFETETLPGTDDEYSLASAGMTPTPPMSQVSGYIFNKRKRSVDSERRTRKAMDLKKTNRHLSFFKGIIPALEEFDEQEVLKFQMGLLQIISNIKDQRRSLSRAQIPAQFLSFSSSSGPSVVPLNTTSYLPTIATSYPSGQPIFPTFWPAICTKCSGESTSQKSSSNPVD